MKCSTKTQSLHRLYYFFGSDKTDFTCLDDISLPFISLKKRLGNHPKWQTQWWWCLMPETNKYPFLGRRNQFQSIYWLLRQLLALFPELCAENNTNSRQSIFLHLPLANIEFHCAALHSRTHPNKCCASSPLTPPPPKYRIQSRIINIYCTEYFGEQTYPTRLSFVIGFAGYSGSWKIERASHGQIKLMYDG